MRISTRKAKMLRAVIKRSRRGEWGRAIRGMNAWASGRINRGDWDFDDVVYATRDHTASILKHWENWGGL